MSTSETTTGFRLNRWRVGIEEVQVVNRTDKIITVLESWMGGTPRENRYRRAVLSPQRNTEARMILTPEKMADIRKFSLNIQEHNVIETMDVEIAALREALQWALSRIDYTALDREGMGRYPDKFWQVKTLALPLEEAK